jgi:hypothetical protein
MDITSFLSLRKPGYNDPRDIADLNYNADLIDTWAQNAVKLDEIGLFSIGRTLNTTPFPTENVRDNEKCFDFSSNTVYTYSSASQTWSPGTPLVLNENSKVAIKNMLDGTDIDNESMVSEYITALYKNSAWIYMIVPTAGLDSPAFAGTPTTPDITESSTGTQIANKNYVDLISSENPVSVNGDLATIAKDLYVNAPRVSAIFSADMRVTPTSTPSGWTKVSNFVFTHTQLANMLIFPIAFSGNKKYELKLITDGSSLGDTQHLTLTGVSDAGNVEIFNPVDYASLTDAVLTFTVPIDLKMDRQFTGIGFSSNGGWRKTLTVDGFNEVLSENSVSFQVNEAEVRIKAYDSIYVGGGGTVASNPTANIAIGDLSLSNNTTGIYNTAVGKNAGQMNAAGNNNVMVGNDAAASAFNVQGSVAIGTNALGNALQVNNSIAIGVNAGATNSSNGNLLGSDNNIFIGNNVRGYASHRYGNLIVIGNSATAKGNNSIQIGNSTAASAYYGAGTSSAWSTSSDERIKEEIEDANTQTCLDDINRLPLKRFKYKDFVTTLGDRHLTGFIAQDFEKVFPKAVDTQDAIFEGEDGEMIEIEGCKSINVSQITPTLVGAIQALTKKIEELEAKLRTFRTSL